MQKLYSNKLLQPGIKVNIQVVPSDGYWNDIWMKKDVAMTRWNQRPADQALNEIYHSGAKWNESLYKNPKFDAIFGMARKELDFEKRKAMYQAAQKMFYGKKVEHLYLTL